MSRDLTAAIRRVSDFPDLEDAWRALEEYAERNIFLSWGWAAASIETSGADLYVIDVREGENVVALGLLSPMVERRHGFVCARQLRLNETGPAHGATLFAEGNGLLTAKERQAEAWAAALTALRKSSAPRWNEVIASGAAPALEAQAREAGFAIHRRAEHPSAVVDLAAVRGSDENALATYLASLSANTRSQINRAIKLYEERGPLSLTRAASVEQAQGFLEEIAKLHEAKWRARHEFNPAKQTYVFDFHRRLIARFFDNGGVELVRVSAADAPLAWIYNLIDGDRVLFYVGGFTMETDNRLKPGLVAHALLIASHLEGGKGSYDFLAGGDRYKFSLGQPGPDSVEFAMQKMTPALQLERGLRGLKRRFTPDKEKGSTSI